MSGFGAYTQNYDTKLMQRPFYRKVGGQDPIQSFVQKSGMNYLRNAERIRDMRFARSNEFNADTAIRAEREDLISKTFYENKGKTDLSGLRSRLGLQLSRTGGALSGMQNKVVGSIYPKKNKKKRKKKQQQQQQQQQQQPRRTPQSSASPQRQGRKRAREPQSPPRSTVYRNAEGLLKRMSAIRRQSSPASTGSGSRATSYFTPTGVPQPTKRPRASPGVGGTARVRKRSSQETREKRFKSNVSRSLKMGGQY